MVFPRFPHYHWWSVSYKKSTKMMDFQMNLETWQQEASLFCNEFVDYPIDFPIDDLTSNEKANIEGSQATLGLSDLGWLDEKVDLSIFDSPNSLLDYPNETETLIEDGAAYLLDFLDGSFNPSYIPSDSFKNSEIELANCLNSQDFMSDTSPEILETHLASPGCTTLQVNSPVFFPAQSPASPYSDISVTPEESSIGLESPETSSITSDVASSNLGSPLIHVTVCDGLNEDLLDSSESVLSIEEVSNSVRKRKFMSNGEEIPKVKVILKQSFRSSGKSLAKPKDRRERKKVQNKEAAARYRTKKRIEEKELSGEVFDLESEQKKLKKKHDELHSEIKYLKNLMCEILQKKASPHVHPDFVTSHSFQEGSSCMFQPLITCVRSESTSSNLDSAEPDVIVCDDVGGLFVSSESELSETFTKSSSKPSPMFMARSEKKKESNRKAAIRYRMRKAMEGNTVSFEIAKLESEQKNLKTKHDKLLSEIKYLKKLYTILQIKGTMK